jgi:hypothetical protein
MAWDGLSHLAISAFLLITIYVADPFFSVWGGISCAALIFLRRRHAKRTFWWKFGLLMTLFYLSYCVVNKLIINTRVTKNICRAGNRIQPVFYHTCAFAKLALVCCSR